MTRILLFFLLISLTLQLSAQNFRFNQFTTEDGISQNFIYSINQDQKGYLWIGTGEGLCKFDGKKFITYGTKDSLNENIITCSFFNKEGDIWFGHNEGSLTQLKNDQFIPTKPNENIISIIKGIDKSQENVFFIGQNEGLCQVDSDRTFVIDDFDKSNFSALKVIDDNNILIGTAEGLIHVMLVNKKWVLKKEILSESWISSITPSTETNTFVVTGQSGGLFKVTLKNGELNHSEWIKNHSFSDVQIKTALFDNKNNLWLATNGQGVIKLHADSSKSNHKGFTMYNTETGLSSDYIQTIFQDREGNIWIGTFGNGLCTLIDDYFTFFANDLKQVENKNINSLVITETDRWYGMNTGLMRVPISNAEKPHFYTDTTSWIKTKVTSLYLNNDTLWVGTASLGLHFYDIQNEKFGRVKWDYGNLQDRINEISGLNDMLVVGTDGGLVTYNINNGRSNLFDTETGLAHNAITAVFQDSRSRIWIGTHSRLLYAINGFEMEKYELTTMGELVVNSINEDKLGDIWIATDATGVFKKIGDKFIHFSERDGLKSNYTYSIHHDVNNNTWVGHRGGLSQINASGEKIVTYDYKDGIKEQMNKNAVYLGPQDYLWFGTDNGAIRYDASKNSINETPPTINITEILIGSEKYSIDDVIELPYGDYRMHFSFIGISLKNPDGVYYQFKLNGYDEIFSDPTKENSATYGKISEGDYIFEVTACNDDGVCSEVTAKVKISVALPIWKKWWFYLILLVFIFGLTNLIIRIRIRRIKKTKEYLEHQLSIKTKEVVEKATHIEAINKDLTSSISYAKRIQTSLLPDLEVLKETLPKSFLYFRPRDIVSGDFYFINQYDDKLIVACVDCTGHGVPGAFMSMIGSVTLRNIYKSNLAKGVWETPETVLEVLDHEIELILKQKELKPDVIEDFLKSREGMDMSLCEINLKTNEVLIASAMRTSLMRKNNKLEVIPGTKRPIGGGEDSVTPFNLDKFQMEPGDGLYMFSDGYTDQFGGEKGRKLKMSGVKKIVASLKSIPSEKHAETIRDEFEDWMGDLDQIDDVLFIGIEF